MQCIKRSTVLHDLVVPLGFYVDVSRSLENIEITTVQCRAPNFLIPSPFVFMEILAWG